MPGNVRERFLRSHKARRQLPRGLRSCERVQPLARPRVLPALPVLDEVFDLKLSALEAEVASKNDAGRHAGSMGTSARIVSITPIIVLRGEGHETSKTL